ncbi:MAG: TetR family transcriptional regulator [Anaerolineaceae bacterium]|nr:TetR family transcriptional regulator [Anaerolineaceae bacterium]
MPKLINEAAVFKAVMGMIFARGYDSATTAEMAAAANIHEATLFRKYESKARLVELAIAQHLADAPLTHVHYTGDLQADIEAILRAYVATVQQRGEIIPLILLEIPRHPELHSTLHVPWSNLQEIIHIIERYQREGRLKSESPLTLISVLIGPIMINQMFMQANTDLPVAEIDIRAYAEGFLHGRQTG